MHMGHLPYHDRTKRRSVAHVEGRHMSEYVICIFCNACLNYINCVGGGCMVDDDAHNNYCCQQNLREATNGVLSS